MTKKDYVEFAKMMSCFQDGEKIIKEQMAVCIATIFACDNSRFDIKRFLDACKYDPDR